MIWARVKANCLASFTFKLATQLTSFHTTWIGFAYVVCLNSTKARSGGRKACSHNHHEATSSLVQRINKQHLALFIKNCSTQKFPQNVVMIATDVRWKFAHDQWSKTRVIVICKSVNSGENKSEYDYLRFHVLKGGQKGLWRCSWRILMVSLNSVQSLTMSTFHNRLKYFVTSLNNRYEVLIQRALIAGCNIKAEAVSSAQVKQFNYWSSSSSEV